MVRKIINTKYGNENEENGLFFMDLNSLQMDEYGEESGCIPGSFVVFD